MTIDIQAHVSGSLSMYTRDVLRMLWSSEDVLCCAEREGPIRSTYVKRRDIPL